MNKKNVTIAISIVSIFLFIVAIVASSYAYYTAVVTQTGDGTSTGMKTAQFNASFIDGPILTFSNIIPGDTFDKTFTLENSGGSSIDYKVVINELENTFIKKEDLKYVLKRGEEVIASGVFPSTTTAISNVITINGGTSHTYTLTVTYENTAEDQSEDMGKTISGKLFIEEV